MIFQHAIWHYDPHSAEVEKYNRIFKTEPLVTKLLLDRGIATYEEAEQFLKPSMAQLHDPFLMADMSKAVARIQEAMTRGQKIWIYGDYDVDGITSIAVLSRYFEFVGYRADYYIPSRQEEGYGLNTTGLDTIKERGGEVIITVDCGITAVEQAAYAKSLGIELIITDHHECQETLPEAVAVINPKREGYPFKMLAGCGVAFKLTQALLGDAFDAFYLSVIDIVALGTVADIVPLVDENRVFTKLGLEQMTHTQNPGVQALIEEAQLQGKEINAGHIGFIIAPRINASGRIGNPSIAVEMLLEKDYFSALQIAKGLSDLNTKRQMQERQIMEEAELYIETSIDLAKEKILLVVGTEWHTGIIGIVASKLTDKYDRPVVVLNLEDGVAKGSARSVDGISIFAVLSRFKELFDKFGGHEQAAGLSLSAKHIPALKEGLMAYGATEIPWRQLVKEQTISAVLMPQMVTHELVDAIEQLKPFGMGNPKPQFVFNHLKIDDYKLIGKAQNHLKLMVNDGVRIYDALAFNQSDNIKFFKKNETLNLLLTLEKNHFRGVETIQFLVKDFVKKNMPLKEQLAFKVYEVPYNHLVSGTALFKGDAAQVVDDVSSLETGLLLIYSLETFNAVKDELLMSQSLAYSLHFGKLSTCDFLEEGLNILYMPAEGVVLNTPYYVLENDVCDNSLGAYYPTRDDMVYLYKWAMKLKKTSLFDAQDKLNFNIAKILCGLALLSDMSLIEYTVHNHYLTITAHHKPKEKMQLEKLELYQKFTARA